MSLPATLDPGLLPGVLREMVGLIGLPATLRIVEAYGGVRLYVPSHMDAGHDLAQLVGFDAASKLSSEYGGMDHFDVPRAAQALRAVRSAQIRADRARGMTHRELARKYALTERWIRHLLGEHDDGSGDQLGLF